MWYLSILYAVLVGLVASCLLDLLGLRRYFRPLLDEDDEEEECSPLL